MERHPAIPPTPSSEYDALEETTRPARRRQQRRERVLLGAWVGVTSFMLVGTAMLLESCGGGESTTRTAGYSHEASSTSAKATVAAGEAQLPEGGEPVGVGTRVLQGSEDPRSVPPDVVAAVSDTFVIAGQPVEVTVEGTPDITEMALSDGRGDAIPMVRDASGQVWRVNYRVPLRPGTDRLGLAVTAKNDSHRWRRVWVFLQINDGKQQVEPEAADSTQIEQR